MARLLPHPDALFSSFGPDMVPRVCGQGVGFAGRGASERVELGLGWTLGEEGYA